MVSEEGVTYMPRGQWALYLKEAYSRETAVRVRAVVAGSIIEEDSDIGASVVAVVGVDRECALELFLFGVDKSIVGEVTKSNIFRNWTTVESSKVDQQVRVQEGGTAWLQRERRLPPRVLAGIPNWAEMSTIESIGYSRLDLLQ